MGYFVTTRKKKKGGIYWRLVFRKYGTDGKVVELKHVAVDEYRSLGIQKEWDLERIQDWMKIKNGEANVRRFEQGRQKSIQNYKRNKLIESVYLPRNLVEGFENDIIKGDVGNSDDGKLKANSVWSHWKLAQEIIAKMAIDPSDWFERRKAVYGEFKRREMSPSYVQKVQRLMNLWGYYYCKRMGKAWERIPVPKNDQLEEIRDAYIDSGGSETESGPFTLAHLKKAKTRLLTNPYLYDWLFVCVWFGLRPSECDRFEKPMTPFAHIKGNKAGAWTLSNDGNVDIIWVYQTKLKKLERKKRWKAIPIVEPEQKEALAIVLAIQSKLESKEYKWKRPLTKTIKSITGPEVNTYGPRKNFFDMMIARGWLDEDVSRWLGHTKLRTTQDHYEDKTIAKYRKTMPAA